MNKNNTCLVNGIILCAVFCYLCVFFSLRGMWNAATIFVVIIIAALSIGQLLLWNMYFRRKKTPRKKKRQ